MLLVGNLWSQMFAEERQDCIHGALIALVGEGGVPLSSEFDSQEAVTQEPLQRVEPGADRGVIQIAQTQCPPSAGTPCGHRVGVAGIQAQIGGSAAPDRQRRGRLGQYRRGDRVVGVHRQGEAPREAHPQGAYAGAAKLGMKLPRQAT